MKTDCLDPQPPTQEVDKEMDRDLPASDYPGSDDTSSCLGNTTSLYDDGNSSVTPTTHECSESWLPPPRPFPKNLAGLSTRKSHPPTITVPFVSGPATANSARSPGADSIHIPTPSAPSPVPLALRPRLVIPSSPPISPYQYSPYLFSSQSLNSARSVKSDLSEVSTSSSYSNPRPPEDSTPYPPTASPLSGYPRGLESRWEIPSGETTILRADEPSSPVYLLDGRSSALAHFASDPTVTPIQAALSESWFQGTPVGRRPEPFPWNDLTDNVRSESGRATPPLEEPFNEIETPRDSIKMDFQTPISLETE